MQLNIFEEYAEFKSLLEDLMIAEGENEDIVNRFQHLLFKTHSCHPEREKVFPVGNKGKGVGARIKDCPLGHGMAQGSQPD